jgi:hypothetical protein
MVNLSRKTGSDTLDEYDEFRYTKTSLLYAAEADGDLDKRVKIFDYIDDENNEGTFYYDMLEFFRFLDPSDPDTNGHIAYTTPDHLLYFNAPNEYIKNPRELAQWDFVYCHECLHQIWDTFAVGEKIKADGLEYNHRLLNIAADCIINDFLRRIEKKVPFEEGIFPETIEEQFGGIKYNPKKDTQYSLYVKLQKWLKDNNEDLNKKINQDEKFKKAVEQSEKHERGDGPNDKQPTDSQDGQQGQGSDGQGQQGQSGDSQDGSQQGQGGDGQGDGDGQSGNQDGDQQGQSDGQGSDGQGQDSQGQQGNQANQGSGSKNNQSKNGAGDGQQGQGNGDGQGGQGGAGKGNGALGDAKEISAAEQAAIREKARKVINKYKDAMSGNLGDFIKKCKSSVKGESQGIDVGVRSGNHSNWNKTLTTNIMSYVSQRVRTRTQYESSWRRISRRQNTVKPGDLLMKGKKRKKDQIKVNIAFYIDCSGSMSSCIDNVFDSAIAIGEALKKNFGREASSSNGAISEFEFKTFVFNDSIHPVEWGKRYGASGGTLPFDGIVDYIKENTNDYLINVIITDAEFDIKRDVVMGMLNEVYGLIQFVTNSSNKTIESMAMGSKGKLQYIEADSNFSV